LKKNYIAGCIFLICTIFTAAAQKQTLKIASAAPPRSPWDIEQKRLGQEWAKISGNQLTVQFFYTSALGGEGSVIQKLRAVRPGQKAPLDGAVFSNIGLYDIAPESRILTLCVPFMFRNQDEVNYIFEKYSGEMKKAFKARGYEVLGWFPAGWIYFSTKEPTETPAKLKSLKLALGGASSSDLAAAFQIAGFNVENISSDKIAQSIKMPGGVQGVYSVPMYTYATKYYETLKYLLDVPICPVFTAFVISDAAWNAVPATYKQQLIDSAKRAESVFSTMQEETDRHYIDLMEKSGVTLVKLSAAQRALWEQELTSDAQRMAANGSTVIDRDFYNRITAALTEYRANVGRP
jgi:TRAP-type C4-dicarboxylate transport system substrate-binding protein